ncbi:Thioredoxin-like fold protein [Actinidia chinensis var. chinensis]|uniref:Thioredoxin-like fold protein n=1 Tax=Actinidia chinensis var. chinensis TaxID=1590841 RepID=A0A2R6QJD6_ACTCC|nr:Thioredoxin-like fold protein [Actinidia chinensis var. chinensis]
MWAKSPARARTTPPHFSCSSFKDVHHLFSDDSNPTPLPPHSNSRKTPSIFHRVRVVNSLLRAWSTRLPHAPPQISAAPSQPPISLPGTENSVVVYFTSLRVVRSTFEDCRAVRSILRGFRVSIDERDVSMDSKYVTELQGILGYHNKAKMSLPRVFIGGRYFGGAEEIRQLHEAGELKKLVDGLPAADSGICGACGGYRFILCDECSGSHKCYSEKGGFRTCTACSENGLIRCPSCSCAPL